MGTIVRPRSPYQVIWAGNYLWRDLHGKGSNRPGVALLDDRRVIQHLTPEQAINLADQLVDAAEAATRGDAPLNDQKGPK
jgi:hypothetical protein